MNINKKASFMLHKSVGIGNVLEFNSFLKYCTCNIYFCSCNLHIVLSKFSVSCMSLVSQLYWIVLE